MREVVLPLMELAKEVAKAGFTMGAKIPEVHCKAFEDNTRWQELPKCVQEPSTST
jgi:hypothetical protein